MLINICEFKRLLKKSTINFSIDSVQLNIHKNNITSKMITPASDAISILNVTNTVLPGMPVDDSFVFNFSEPSTTLVPYLSLIDEDVETEIKIHDEKITIIQGKQKSNMFFCSPQVVSVFEADSPRADIEYFKTISIDGELIESLNKIKKIGSKFNKVYFGVENKTLYVETSDRTNRFSNGLRVDIAESDTPNLTMCFDYKNLFNTFAVLNGNTESFKINLAYVSEQELGMLYIGKDDETEKYYLMSKRDSN